MASLLVFMLNMFSGSNIARQGFEITVILSKSRKNFKITASSGGALESGLTRSGEIV